VYVVKKEMDMGCVVGGGRQRVLRRGVEGEGVEYWNGIFGGGEGSVGCGEIIFSGLILWVYFCDVEWVVFCLVVVLWEGG